ncbi:hypothetical protein QMZ05_20110 [Bradyrhizobium sp. INPA03-11B]
MPHALISVYLQPIVIVEPVRLARRARREDIPVSGRFGRNNLIVLTS